MSIIEEKKVNTPSHSGSNAAHHQFIRIFGSSAHQTSAQSRPAARDTSSFVYFMGKTAHLKKSS